MLIELHSTEQVSLAATLYASIREQIGSNLGWGTDYPVSDFCGFPQYLQENSGILPRLGFYCFLSDPFQSITHPSFEAV
jgi:predicted TIM-barrel fold metal-dependent hydrolase